MDHREIAEHWRRWAREFGSELQATTKTRTIKELEIAALARALDRIGFGPNSDGAILEVGCGNGHNLFALARRYPGMSFTGVDYVAEMIEAADQRQTESPSHGRGIEFRVGDALRLDQVEGLGDRYDVVLTDRCLINLTSLDEQLRAFEQACLRLRPGGRFLMLENSIQGRGRQNALREAIGLPPRDPPAFNLFIDEEPFLERAAILAELESVDDFASLHDVVLYVLTPLVGGEVDYDHPLVRGATDLLLSLSERGDADFGSFGQNRLFVFRRSPSTLTSNPRPGH